MSRDELEGLRKKYVKYVIAYLKSNPEILREKDFFSVESFLRREKNIKVFREEGFKPIYSALIGRTTPADRTLELIQDIFKIPLSFHKFEYQIYAKNPEYLAYVSDGEKIDLISYEETSEPTDNAVDALKGQEHMKDEPNKHIEISQIDQNDNNVNTSTDVQKEADEDQLEGKQISAEQESNSDAEKNYNNQQDAFEQQDVILEITEPILTDSTEKKSDKENGQQAVDSIAINQNSDATPKINNGPTIEQKNSSNSEANKNDPSVADTPPPSNTPPSSREPVTPSPQLPEESFLKRYKFSIIALILFCILLVLFYSLQRKIPQKVTVVDSAKITQPPPINNTDTSVSESSTIREPYKTVRINGHDWMAENLDVGSYRDGTPIKEVENTEDWKKCAYLKEGCWCYYHFDPANGKIYGKIYNWYAVVDKAHGGIAPAGFRIPTVKEFDALLHIAGTPQYKLMATKGWAGGASGTNEAGFNAVPSGSISAYSDQFLNAGSKATYWTINESVAKPWTFSLSLNPNDKIFDVCSFYGGCAVRCLRATK